jgi:hypothetical protein
MRSSTPSVIHVGPSSRWRLRARDVFPELEPPFKTITGFTGPTILAGTGGCRTAGGGGIVGAGTRPGSGILAGG